MDQNTRRRMSREKKGAILKVVVKHFFIEKEVTSTLVMDSLYSGIKALEDQSQHKKGKAKMLEGEETPPPIIRTEKDTFVLVDDVLLLLEKAAMEPLPPKDDKGPQNRTKDGGGGEDFNKDSIERDERRLTELGRRTVEIFVLAHIFSNKIEVAYQEAVALRRQEELIREEEAEWLAESELKSKRGVGEKDKKSKKKQGKQKRNNRRGKDKLKDEKPVVTADDKQLHENPSSEGKELNATQAMTEKDDALEEVSDVSDMAESAVDMLQPDSEDREGSPVNWDMDSAEIQPQVEASGSEVSCISAVHNGGLDKRSSSIMDDSSSTCSTDSTPSVVTNGSYRSSSFVNYKSQKLPARDKNQQGKGAVEECSGSNEADSRQSQPAEVHASPGRKTVEANKFEGTITSLQDRTKWPELNAIKKEDEIFLSQKKQNDNVQTKPKEKDALAVSSPKNPPRNTISMTSAQPKPDLKAALPANQVSPRKTSSNEQQQSNKPTSPSVSRILNPSRVDLTMANIPKHTEKPTLQQSAGLSRPSSAPLNPGTLSPSPAVSMVQVAAPSSPMLSRSVSATGPMGPDPSLAKAPPYVPQSYRTTISSGGFTHSPQAPNSMVNMSTSFGQHPSLVPNPVLRGQPWMDSSRFDSPSIVNDIPHLDLYRPVNNGPNRLFPSEMLAGTSGRPVQTALADEFPHLDIINDLLDDEQVIGRTHGEMVFPRQFTYPRDTRVLIDEGNMGTSCRFDRYRSYPNDGFQQDYGPGSPYHSARDFTSQGNSIPYLNGQIDNLTHNQWQSLGPDLSLRGLRSSGLDGYSYNVPEYSDMACGVNGYAMFRPSNGH